MNECSGGRMSMIALNIEQGDSQSNLVAWMCEISRELCQKANAAPVTTTSTTQTATPPPSLIHIVRDLREVDKGDGHCSGQGLISRVLPAQSARECRIKCSQLVQMSLSTGEETHLTHNCKGFAWNGRSQQCALYEKAEIAGADGVAGWKCSALLPVADSFHRKTSTTPRPRTLPPLPEKRAELRLSEALNLAAADTALRVRVAALSAECFAPVDWYTMDSTVQVPSSDWGKLVK